MSIGDSFKSCIFAFICITSEKDPNSHRSYPYVYLISDSASIRGIMLTKDLQHRERIAKSIILHLSNYSDLLFKK